MQVKVVILNGEGKLRFLTVSIAALVLTACSTVPSDLSLGTGLNGETPDDKALVVLAVGPLTTAGHFQLQKINDERTGFTDESVTLSFGAYGGGSKMKSPEGEKSSFWRVQTEQVNFLAGMVSPGLYAATDTSYNGFNGVSTIVYSSCNKDGAPTFEVVPGQINILESHRVFPQQRVARMSASHNEQTIKEAFVRTRAGYPELKGDVVFKVPTQEARWIKADDKFFGNSCGDVSGQSLTLSALQAGGSPRQADDADRAAIDAALENLKVTQ